VKIHGGGKLITLMVTDKMLTKTYIQEKS